VPWYLSLAILILLILISFLCGCGIGEQDHDDMEIYNALHISLHHYPLTEVDYPIEERLPEAVIVTWWNAAHEIIIRAHEHKQNVLVHCVEGVNRSVSTLIYHLMHYTGKDTKTTSIASPSSSQPSPSPSPSSPPLAISLFPMTFMTACQHMKKLRPIMDLDHDFVELLIQLEPSSSHNTTSSTTVVIETKESITTNNTPCING
jgi:hypothetical protein